MRVNMMLHESDEFTVRVGASDTDKPFVVMRFGDIHVFLPGFGEENEKQTRELAEALIEAADSMRASLIAAHAAEAALVLQEEQMARDVKEY